MAYVSQTPENVKAEIGRQLAIAERAADAYGTSPEEKFRAHGRFDFADVITGELLHDPDCPFCRLRRLRRDYGFACLAATVGRMPS